MTDLRIDVFELARRNGTLSGRLAIAQLARLADAVAGAQGEVGWQLRGWQQARAGAQTDRFMELSLEASVHPACVQCLEAVEVPVRETRRYRLVASEAEAARLDPDDDAFDVLAGSSRFDLASLIEDELILSLPAVPRHQVCGAGHAKRGGEAPDDPGFPADEPLPEENAGGPFAALRQLRRNGPPSSR